MTKPRTITSSAEGSTEAVGCVILTRGGEVLMKSTQTSFDGIRALWWRCGWGHNMTTLETEHLPAKVLHDPTAS